MGFFYDWWMRSDFRQLPGEPQFPLEYPCGTLPGDWNYHSKGDNVKRALIRFGRIIIAAVLAATIGAAIQNVGELPISDQGTVCLLTAALVALDKFLRDRGVY